MRSWKISTHLFIPVGLLALMAGCGGGGSSSSGGGGTVVSNPPVTTFSGITPNDSPLKQYQSYAFAADATVVTIGRSVANYKWDFGDGSAVQTIPAVAGKGAVNYAYKTAGSYVLRVIAVDDQGALGSTASANITVIAAPTPVTVTIVNPTAPSTLQVASGLTVQTSFTATAVTTSGGTIAPSNLTFDPGETTAVVGTITANGSTFTIPVTYSAAAVLGSRTVNPVLTVIDSKQNSSGSVAFPTLTIKTSGINTPPTLQITTPATPSTNGFTSKKVDLGFTGLDKDGDILSYTVDWGDSNKDTGTLTGDSTVGATAALTHVYADAFTSSSKNAVVTVTVDDGRTAAASLPSKSCTFTIAYNSFPVATITTPQASATLPATAIAGVVNPPTANDPDIVVVPNGGKLAFIGTGTLPGSADAGLTYKWTFENGAPATASTLTPGDVFFTGVAGQMTPCKVELTVTDAFGRVSKNGPSANVKTYQKWVVVDGVHTQNFNLALMFRQKSDNNGIATLTPALTAANGLGALIQIFQDGTSNSYAVQSGNQATVAVPVRSDLPFYVKIPSFGADTRTYLMRIPNAPTGPYSDPSLASSLTWAVPASTSGFGFQNPSAAPWNPTLQIVTGQGFAPEIDAAPMKFMAGLLFNTQNVNTSMTLGTTPTNTRWVDRLSVPGTDPTKAIQFETTGSNAGALTPYQAYQSFAEWTIFPLCLAQAPTTTPGGSATVAFAVDYAKYTASTQISETYGIDRMQAFRVPGGSTDPYNLGTGPANWNLPSCVSQLNPTPMVTGVTAVPGLFARSIDSAPGSAPLAGGIKDFIQPYSDPNEPNRLPSTPVTRSFDGLAATFSYAEYLWSSVWARPLVLNSARLQAGTDPTTFSMFLHSNPGAWPKFLDTSVGITPDKSTFDLTPTGGPAFTAATPVGVNGAAPGSGGVGHFYWTAFTPSYNGLGGGLITRTWLSSEITGLPPLSYPQGTASGDATSVLGLIPPQDTIVFKQQRDPATGLVTAPLGGYRVVWYNPTKDANGGVVAPDFWVVALGSQHFVLPASYPVTQKVSDTVLTDARTYLPSGKTTLQAGDTVAPGYCWFDVPVELRPTAGSATTLTVFAVKSILRNNPVASARALNRPDWLDAIKTATANITAKPSMDSGLDLSFAHKLPFNFPWDIVVVNAPPTPVAP